MNQMFCFDELGRVITVVKVATTVLSQSQAALFRSLTVYACDGTIFAISCRARNRMDSDYFL